MQHVYNQLIVMHEQMQGFGSENRAPIGYCRLVKNRKDQWHCNCVIRHLAQDRGQYYGVLCFANDKEAPVVLGQLHRDARGEYGLDTVLEKAVHQPFGGCSVVCLSPSEARMPETVVAGTTRNGVAGGLDALVMEALRAKGMAPRVAAPVRAEKAAAIKAVDASEEPEPEVEEPQDQPFPEENVEAAETQEEIAAGDAQPTAPEKAEVAAVQDEEEPVQETFEAKTEPEALKAQPEAEPGTQDETPQWAESEEDTAALEAEPQRLDAPLQEEPAGQEGYDDMPDIQLPDGEWRFQPLKPSAGLRAWRGKKADDGARCWLLEGAPSDKPPIGWEQAFWAPTRDGASGCWMLVQKPRN